MNIVRVWINNPLEGSGIFNGTAFFINSNTLITAKHVVLDKNPIYINELKGGGTLKIEADDITFCKRDIAILKVKKDFDIPKINLNDKISEGIAVTIKGYYDKNSSINDFNHHISGYLNNHHTLYPTKLYFKRNKWLTCLYQR